MRKALTPGRLVCVTLCILVLGSKSWANTVWAAEVHNYVPGTNTVPGDGPAVNALGPWDTYHENHTWYGYPAGIGVGGVLELRMGLPFLNGPGDDITVYEVGTSVGGANDSFDAYISTDGVNYSFVGSSPGDHTPLDISAVGEGPFEYVKLVGTNLSDPYDGPEIDAVSASHPVPEPSTMLGGFLGLAGVAGYMKRRWNG